MKDLSTHYRAALLVAEAAIDKGEPEASVISDRLYKLILERSGSELTARNICKKYDKIEAELIAKNKEAIKYLELSLAYHQAEAELKKFREKWFD